MISDSSMSGTHLRSGSWSVKHAMLKLNISSGSQVGDISFVVFVISQCNHHHHYSRGHQTWRRQHGQDVANFLPNVLHDFYASVKVFSEKWANPGLFSIYFRLFNMSQFKLCWGLEPERQDGRCRRVHWATAAPQRFFGTPNARCAFTRRQNEIKWNPNIRTANERERER